MDEVSRKEHTGGAGVPGAISGPPSGRPGADMPPPAASDEAAVDAPSALITGIVLGALLGAGVVWCAYAGDVDARVFQSEKKTADARDTALLCDERLRELRNRASFRSPVSAKVIVSGKVVTVPPTR
jgi:hypothetical protein